MKTEDGTRKQPVIEVSGLSYAISDNRVLEDLSFVINEGDYVGLLGPNGSGKTTLLKLLLGLLAPDSGKISICGAAPEDLNHRVQIGYVPQRASRTDWEFPATVREVVLSGRTPLLKTFQGFSAQDRIFAQQAMEIVDVSALADRTIGELSGGQRQRVFIARALSAQPKLLILDEPTTGVDVTVQHAFYAFLKKLNTEYGITIVLVSHDIDAITHESSSVLCINKTLVCHMPTQEFLDSTHLSELFGHHATHVYHDHSAEHTSHN